MAFFTQNRSQLISVANGQVRRHLGDGNLEIVGNGFEGILVKIEKKEVEIRGEQTPKIFFTFRDGHEEFRLSTILYDGLCNEIARTLPNVPDFSKKLTFTFWEKVAANGKKYTNLSITQDGKRIPWSDMPQPEKFERGNEVYTSYGKRNDFVLKALLSVQEKLKAINPDVQEPADGDMPDDVYEDPMNAPTAPMAGAPYGAPAAPYGGQPGVPYMGQPAGQYPGYAGQPVGGPYYPAQAPYGPQNGGPQGGYGQGGNGGRR